MLLCLRWIAGFGFIHLNSLDSLVFCWGTVALAEAGAQSAHRRSSAVKYISLIVCPLLRYAAPARLFCQLCFTLAATGVASAAHIAFHTAPSLPSLCGAAAGVSLWKVIRSERLDVQYQLCMAL